MRLYLLTPAGLQNTEVLHKDSIYAAIGLAAPVLEEKLDFQAFLTSTLVSEVLVQQPGYNILRRRIAIILGQWLPIKEGLDRPLVYQTFQHLLDKEDPLNDQVVRVTAGRQLKSVIDPFEFASEPFMPYAPNILGRMMELTKEVELPETKMALLNTISVIVLRMERHVQSPITAFMKKANFLLDIPIRIPNCVTPPSSLGPSRRGISHETDNPLHSSRPRNLHERRLPPLPSSNTTPHSILH